MNNSSLSVKCDKNKSTKPSLVLESTVYTQDQLPVLDQPQIAIVGRSNVGKSSLINALAGRKNLAKIGATPGKTRSINFFKVLPLNFYLVDLPGYGYAKASHADRKKWMKLLEYYLSETKTLHTLIFLLDCRLPPQKSDLELVNYARERQLSLLPVLTKIDKCNKRERDERLKEWLNILGESPVLTSSTKGFGIEDLWSKLTLWSLE